MTLATVIATPLGYYALDILFDEIYVYRVPITATPFVIATVLVFVTAVATISSHIYRVAVSSPVEGLRSE